MSTLSLQFLILTMAGRVNGNQQDVIDYLREENRPIVTPDTLLRWYRRLAGKLGGRRVREALPLGEKPPRVGNELIEPTIESG